MIPSTYADAFSILGSLTDMKIDFMSVAPHINQEGNIDGEERTIQQRIVLSLPLAKDFCSKLSKAVENYESNFGEILNLDKARSKMDAKNNG